MNTPNAKTRLKIGYMPLAHETYWHYFPEHKEPALNLARQLKSYLSSMGTIYETGKLIDSFAHSQEARLLFQAEDVDVIILATVTYSTPDDILLDLKKFPRPTIVWNTQASAGIPDNLDFNQWMLEHGVTGVPGITNLLVRENMPYFLISGHLSHESVRQSFLTVLKAVAATKRLWGARIGLFGHIYPGMVDFGYDPTRMYSTFGVWTVPILESVVEKAFDEIEKNEVAALDKELKEKYTLADEFQDKEFTHSVRLALAMKKVVRDNQLDALTVYCQSMWQKPQIGVVSCIGNSLLLQEGVFCSCEGDVLTSLAGMILEQICGKAIFTEIWANDFDRNQFMMGHSGQMNLALFEENTKLVKLSRHPWWNGCCGRGACLQVKMPSGPATMVSITPANAGSWRMIVTLAEVTERAPVPLGAPNFFMNMNMPISDFLGEWGKAGASHHFAMAYGNQIESLKAVARILGIEAMVI